MNAQATVFIPGIKGTTLVNTNRADFNTIWTAIQSQYEDLSKLEISLDQQGNAVDLHPDTIINPGEIEGLAYGEFLHDLDQKNPIYIFNYDWRFTSLENTKKLQSFMSDLQHKSKVSKAFNSPIKRFNIITHSQGSAIARQLTKAEGFKRIGKIILVTPPLLGALDTVDVVLTGEGFLPGVSARIRKLIRTFPGALELLPRYASAYFDSGKAVDFFNVSHWQKNVVDSNNSESDKFIKALNFAKKSINQLDDWSQLKKSLRDRILIIARDGYKTAQSVQVIISSKEPDNFVNLNELLYTSSGDGRVAHASSCIWHNKITTLMATDAWRYRDYGHSFILKDERVQKIVNRFLFSDKTFDWNFPSHSIKQVVDLKLEQQSIRHQTNHQSKLNNWTAILK